MNQPPDPEKDSFWSRVWRRPKSRWRLGIPPGGLVMFILGILFWGGFNWTLEMSNTETFCISCHEMRAFVYPEYQETIHYSNRTGVRASCPDCHVPHDYVPKLHARSRRPTSCTTRSRARSARGKNSRPNVATWRSGSGGR